jgi:hypothetical protein
MGCSFSCIRAVVGLTYDLGLCLINKIWLVCFETRVT